MGARVRMLLCVYLQGVGKVDIIVTSETAKVGDKTLTRGHAVVVESPTLPLGQAEGYFELDILKVARGKGRGAFDTVEVVIESRLLGEEERTRNTLEVDVFLELILKGQLDELQGFFLLQQVLEDGLVLVHDFLGRETSQRVFGVKRSGHVEMSVTEKAFGERLASAIVEREEDIQFMKVRFGFRRRKNEKKAKRCIRIQSELHSRSFLAF